jgi:redox-sensing transcriptional repressor
MKKESNLPPPTLERLARLYVLLGKLQQQGLGVVSSKRLSELLGVPDHTIRKDLSCLRDKTFVKGKPGDGGKPADTEWAKMDKPGASGGRGYPLDALRTLIGEQLGLTRPRTACLVGLGNLGVAILHRKIWQEGVYRLVAAFDSSENRLELLSTKVPLYHARELEGVVRKQQIEIGILTVPPEAAQETADRLVRSGIRGIVNFAPVVLSVKSDQVVVRNVSLAGELNILSAYLYQQEEEHG